MDIIPLEVRIGLFLDADVTSIHYLCQSNKEWSDLCRTNYFWRRKYEYDYHQNIEDDSFVDILKLTPKQAYIRRYTQEGGVTYGSQSFQSLSNLLPKAIRSADNRLIDYYMDLLDKLVVKYQHLSQDRRSFYFVIDWYEAIKAALWIGDLDMAFKMQAIAGDNIPNTRYVSNRTASSLDNGNLLINGALGNIAQRPKNITDAGNLIRLKHLLEGALLAQNYASANRILKQGFNAHSVARIAIELDEYDWLEQTIGKYPDLFTNDVIIGAGITNNILDEDIIPTNVTPQDIFRIMHSQYKYDTAYIRNHITGYIQFIRDNDYMEIPCDDTLLNVLRQNGVSEDKIQKKVIVSTCQTTQDFLTFRKRQPSITEISQNIEDGKYDIALDLINADLAILTSNDKMAIGRDALFYGKKDFWFYLRHLIGSTNTTIEAPFIQMPVDMLLLVHEINAHPERSFVQNSRSVFDNMGI